MIRKTARRRSTRVLAANAAAILFMLYGCGSDSPTATEDPPPPKPPLDVVGGEFDVSTWPIFDSCALVWGERDGTFDIAIDNDQLTITCRSTGEVWEGTWDANLDQGYAETPHEKRQIRYCTVTTWTRVIIDFSSEDDFTGSIAFRRRVNGECDDPCLTTWGLDANRLPGGVR